MSANRKNTRGKNTRAKQSEESGMRTLRVAVRIGKEPTAEETIRACFSENALEGCQAAGANSGLLAGATMNLPLLGALPEDSTAENTWQVLVTICESEGHQTFRVGLATEAMKWLDVQLPKLLEFAGSRGAGTVHSAEGQRMYVMEHCISSAFAAAMRYKLALQEARAELAQLIAVRDGLEMF